MRQQNLAIVGVCRSIKGVSTIHNLLRGSGGDAPVWRIQLRGLPRDAGSLTDGDTGPKREKMRINRVAGCRLV